MAVLLVAMLCSIMRYLIPPYVCWAQNQIFGANITFCSSFQGNRPVGSLAHFSVSERIKCNLSVCHCVPAKRSVQIEGRARAVVLDQHTVDTDSFNQK